MKKVLITIISMLLPLIASALGTNVNGIYYLFDSSQKTATVTCEWVRYWSGGIDDWQKADYSGAIDIPSEVTYNEETYKVTAVGDAAFADCTTVTSISIPESVESIGNYAFHNCSSLSITIPDNVTSVSSSAFGGTPWYNSQPEGLLYLDNWLIGYKGDKPTGNLNIEDGTKGIAVGAFWNCSGLKAVTIPNSLLNICLGAFQKCSGLTSVTFGSGLTSIDSDAFNNCSSLTSINIPNNVTSISISAFAYCTGLKSVELHVKTIEGWFGSSVETLTIGSEVESINEKTFYGFSNIQRIYISDLSKWCKISLNNYLSPQSYIDEDKNTIVYPGNYQLYLNGEELTNLIIPEDVESIGSYIFSGCSSLTSVTIGSGVTNIGESAFYKCQNLTDVYLLPENVPEIGGSVFPYNQNITLHVPNASYLKQPWVSFGTIVPLSGGEFEGVDNTIINFADATVKQSLLVRCDYNGDGEISMWEAAAVDNVSSFNSSQITSFNELKFFTKITTIPSKSFLNCSKLISITIPENVTSIGKCAFSGCTSLTQLYCMAEEPPSASSAFESYYQGYPQLTYPAVNKNSVTLYVPASSFNLYSTQEPWKSFKEILTIDGSEVVVPKCATPTISVVEGKIKFSCETEDVSFVSSITMPTSSKSADGTEISLSNKYKVTVFAKKRGYIDSDIAEAEFVGSLIRGDLNNDGIVNVADHVDLSKIIMGQE